MPSRTVTFAHPFTLPGMERAHPAGMFTVNEESETLDVVWPAYRLTTTLMIPTAGGYEGWAISAADLEQLLARDKADTSADPSSA